MAKILINNPLCKHFTGGVNFIITARCISFTYTTMAGHKKTLPNAEAPSRELYVTLNWCKIYNNQVIVLVDTN